MFTYDPADPIINGPCSNESVHDYSDTPTTDETSSDAYFSDPNTATESSSFQTPPDPTETGMTFKFVTSSELADASVEKRRVWLAANGL